MALRRPCRGCSPPEGTLGSIVTPPPWKGEEGSRRTRRPIRPAHCQWLGVGAPLSERNGRLRLLPTLLAVLSFHADAHHHKPTGCLTRACYRRVWIKQHPRPRFRFGVTELCEAGRESGAGSVVTRANARALAHDINWRMESGGYEAGYSWLPSTWRSMRFPGMPERAVDATPQQQTEVFRKYKSVSQWPPLAYCL